MDKNFFIGISEIISFGNDRRIRCPFDKVSEDEYVVGECGREARLLVSIMMKMRKEQNSSELDRKMAFLDSLIQVFLHKDVFGSDAGHIYHIRKGWKIVTDVDTATKLELSRTAKTIRWLSVDPNPDQVVAVRNINGSARPALSRP